MSISVSQRSNITRIARAGLIAKGIVYVLLGMLAFMAAFEIGGQTTGGADRAGVFGMLKDMPAGTTLLALVAIGLVCYAAWRGIQAFGPGHRGGEPKAGKRALYFFSGLAYLSVALTAGRLALYNEQDNGGSNQQLASRLLEQSYGQWLLGIAALIMAAVGIYQLYYGLSEKYRKHVQGLSLSTPASSLLLRSGKIGYVARGVVWLVIAWLLLKAALSANAAKAGDTAQAFQFVESSTAGSLLLGALGVGLAAYGVFNFIRARYENFY
ncbi:MAG TPA: DUF1206 domain-containing protein [Chitinophagaceae bacterium]